jgi:alcohol dehydrogenase class IV
VNREPAPRSDFLLPIELLHPPIIELGPGKVGSVGRWAEAKGLRRALVVTGASNAQRVGLLGLSGEVTVFGAVEPEPSVPNLEQLLAAAEVAEADIVVGFGGGSAMDLAKLAAVLPGSGQTIFDVVGPGAGE